MDQPAAQTPFVRSSDCQTGRDRRTGRPATPAPAAGGASAPRRTQHRHHPHRPPPTCADRCRLAARQAGRRALAGPPSPGGGVPRRAPVHHRNRRAAPRQRRHAAYRPAGVGLPHQRQPRPAAAPLIETAAQLGINPEENPACSTTRPRSLCAGCDMTPPGQVAESPCRDFLKNQGRRVVCVSTPTRTRRYDG